MAAEDYAGPLAARLGGRRMRRPASAVSVLLGAALLLSACSHSSKLEYSGTIETREIQIGSKVGGRVTVVPVEEGQMVKAGMTLVFFECEELKAQQRQLQAKVGQAAAELNRFQDGYRPEEIAQTEAVAQQQHALFQAAQKGPREQELQQAQADYTAAKAEARNAEITFRRMEMLIRGETISQQQYDDARARRDATAERAESARQHLALLQAGTRTEDLKAAEERYHEARAAADLMHRGYRKEDIAAARQRLTEARGALDEINVRLREAELITPSNAVVQTVSIRPGDLVPAGRIVMTLLESSQLWVKIYVPEPELGRVAVGQRAAVHVDSFPNRAFTGLVEQVSSQAEFLPRNVQTRSDREHQVFGVKVRVENPDAVLKSGMTATVQLQ